MTKLSAKQPMLTRKVLRTAGQEAINATGLPMLVEKTKETAELWPNMDRTAQLGAIAANALTDTFDGNIARKTGGKTPLGAAFDPLSDKWTSWIEATSLAARGRISWAHPVVRIGRDITVSWYRDKATRESGGTVDISAAPTSDPLSGKYSTINFFITNALLDSPLGKRLSPEQREVVAWISTTHLAVTGVANIMRLRNARRKAANS